MGFRRGAGSGQRGHLCCSGRGKQCGCDMDSEKPHRYDLADHLS